MFPKSDMGSMNLGTSALAAAMAMSPLFQHQQAFQQQQQQQQQCFGDPVSFMRGCPPQPGLMNGSWNPVLAAAAAAFASGRLVSPNLSLPPKLGEEKLEGEEDDDEEAGEHRSSRSVSPLHLSGTASSTEGIEAAGDGSGHHWTFQEQFKQVT